MVWYVEIYKVSKQLENTLEYLPAKRFSQESIENKTEYLSDFNQVDTNTTLGECEVALCVSVQV